MTLSLQVATLMKRGYPADESQRLAAGSFPTLTHTRILKDTWSLIVEQVPDVSTTLEIGVARWHLFEPKNPNLGNIWRALDWKRLAYCMAT
jgi:hypothetical protein